MCVGAKKRDAKFKLISLKKNLPSRLHPRTYVHTVLSIVFICQYSSLPFEFFYEQLKGAGAKKGERRKGWHLLRETLNL